MFNIVIQPCNSRDARRHESITMDSTNPINIIQLDLLSEYDKTLILQRHPNGQVHLWGNTSGKRDANMKPAYVANIQTGDIAVFTRNKRAYKQCTITHTFHNTHLANYIWGLDEKNNLSYEWMYTTTTPETINIPYEILCERFGLNTSYCFPRVRRFRLTEFI